MTEEDRTIVTSHFELWGEEIPNSMISLPLPKGMPTVDGKEYPLSEALDQSRVRKLPVMWGEMELHRCSFDMTKIMISMLPPKGDNHAVVLGSVRIVLFFVDAKYLLSVHENA
jgi:hypothetical protein